MDQQALSTANIRAALTARRDRIVAALRDPTTPAVLRKIKEWSELPAVDAALEQLDRGRYGRCVDCDEAIAPRRLAIRPTAIRCTRCQTGQEVNARDDPDDASRVEGVDARTPTGC